ncbi:DNA topoisomerase [Campylobacter upsaliensis]|nr:type IA DNA topoisomerase [Campylobacter upsaliensis]EAJ4502898.1 type IA DNA topoisomerase [Campylobacter upsaliensis]EAJ5079788.1 type IA DNA topoisomerase [Campylobacter upsaliensis]EAK0955155.1 type IA DNA topoisomerase [Campylobacter upsaliensis]EBD1833521.1 type IA DNA topoisomerase [Campylobacter upsaliensis]
MSIIIIESPNKIEKVKKYSNCETFATKGHFKSLTKNFIKNYDNYEIEYDFSNEETRKRMNFIFSKCKNEDVIIATDPDREGYAIGYMFYQIIKNSAKSVKRAEFFEITQAGIKKGLENAIDFQKTNFKDFESFKARAVGDKLVGFILSPKYMREMNDKNISVGRVQTPALELIVKKQLEIEEFEKLKEEEKISYKAKALLKTKDSKEFEVLSENVYSNLNEIEEFLNFIKDNSKALLQDIKEKQSQKAPPQPFRTSQLQERANIALSLAPDEIMLLAGELFEAGLITYTRTDSNTLSNEFINELEERFKNETWYEKRIYEAGKQSQAQAHEAIRITHIHPYEECENIVKQSGVKFSQSLIDLYKFIYENSILSQSKNCISLNQTYEFSIKGIIFKATQSKIIDKGFKEAKEKLFKSKELEDEENKEEKNLKNKIDLSSLKQNESFDIVSFEKVEIKKQAPSPYKESNFIALLEKEGIGRPSTYASFLPKLLQRAYIEIEKKGKNSFIKATQKGLDFMQKIRNLDEWIATSEYTRHMENVLDSISRGEVSYLDFIKPLHQKMQFIKINNEEKAPSEAQIALLNKLAKEQNVKLDEEVFLKANLAKKNIEELLKNSIKAPSPKQIALAEKLSQDKKLELPKGYKENMKICSAFIDKCFKEGKKKGN